MQRNLIEIAAGGPQGEGRHYNAIGGDPVALALVARKPELSGKAPVLVYIGRARAV